MSHQTDAKFHEAIHNAIMVAFEAGRKAEREKFWKAINLNKTFNEIDEFIYIPDLKDGLEEVENEREARVS